MSAITLALSKPALTKAITINTKGQPTLGNPAAPVHIVAFEDLKCPNCARFNVEVLPGIKKKYINTGIAKYTLITLAFLPGSPPAGNAALCLYKQSKNYFFPFVSYFYQHQPDEIQNLATTPRLLQFARNSVRQANMKQLSNCIVSSHYSDALQKNLKIAKKTMNPVAAPAVYVNGVNVEPLTQKRLEVLIKEVRSRAKN
ncbi:DsbA family protein [Coxiella endosymbiont of Ornithodoros amblus]|uniref:DsbA family protein n=1 Tax=Coxiella endosymbiont of Ornithodoros amblus TaxID=1656166 RepID=UPI00244DA776|nr:DsbA family protein [Coxiella endosymbiont of Ornithodoros amblus]MBW5802432.1 DsbA family protein [Coxiella endosymbiont of Ornithodoros amblus]